MVQVAWEKGQGGELSRSQPSRVAVVRATRGRLATEQSLKGGKGFRGQSSEAGDDFCEWVRRSWRRRSSSLLCDDVGYGFFVFC